MKFKSTEKLEYIQSNRTIVYSVFKQKRIHHCDRNEKLSKAVYDKVEKKKSNKRLIKTLNKLTTARKKSL